MAEERDPDISRRYRELGAEEPPRALDEAILAASRRRAPRRWAVPVALAAVLVLAVAVTVQVEREKPDALVVAESSKVPPAPPAAATKPVPKFQPPAPRVFVPDPPKAEAPRQPALAAATADVAEPRAEQRNAESSRRDARAAAAPQAMMRAPAPMAQTGRSAETPERELERIAGLRAKGSHEEADKALAEFRKRYPDYRLTDEMRAKVERR